VTIASLVLHNIHDVDSELKKLMFKRKKTPPPQTSQRSSSPATPTSPTTGAISADEQRFLEGFEKMVKESKPEVDAATELRQERRADYDKIEGNFKPATSLYDRRKPRTGGGFTPDPPSNPNSTSPRDDPRYRSFYQGRDQRTGSSAPAATPTSPARAQANSTDVAPGAIVQFDDNSIAIFKDAVSGKDYALFYFLEPDMTLAPRGIFLEQYEMSVIGNLSADAMGEMTSARQWDRDQIIFHLAKFEYAQAIRQLLLGNAGHGPSAIAGAPPQPKSPQAQPAPATSQPPGSSSTPPAGVPQQPQFQTGDSADMLERGRQLRINVGGRMWESIYWTSDEIGPIVAHNTNREWALMHLDLARFKDAIEYGSVLPEADLRAIAESVARSGK
jgi:hypothetical protein